MSNSPPTTALPLDDRLERVAQHIVRARLFLELWYYFEEHNSRQLIIDTMQDYSEFFRFTPHAYFVSFTVYAAGVFETRSDTINLPSLVRETSGLLNGTEASKMDSLMALAKPIARKVSILRNNAIAHRTARMSYDDVFNLASVTPPELRDLTDLALDIANRLLKSRGRKEQGFTELPCNDAAEMMAALAR